MLERASLFLLGGGAYAALELAWRGTTHWTMFLTGGVCLCLLQALADRPLRIGEHDRRVTMSLGLAQHDGHPDPDYLIRAADRALYRAKENGRNRVEIA